mgnify:CR=1 FL=1
MHNFSIRVEIRHYIRYEKTKLRDQVKSPRSAEGDMQLSTRGCEWMESNTCVEFSVPQSSKVTRVSVKALGAVRKTDKWSPLFPVRTKMRVTCHWAQKLSLYGTPSHGAKPGFLMQVQSSTSSSFGLKSTEGSLSRFHVAQYSTR